MLAFRLFPSGVAIANPLPPSHPVVYIQLMSRPLSLHPRFSTFGLPRGPPHLEGPTLFRVYSSSTSLDFPPPSPSYHYRSTMSCSNTAVHRDSCVTSCASLPITLVNKKGLRAEPTSSPLSCSSHMHVLHHYNIPLCPLAPTFSVLVCHPPSKQILHLWLA